jgi:hypothetical protein
MPQCSTASPDPLEKADPVKKATGVPGKRCYTINEWCKIYSLSRSSFYILVASGELKPIRLAGRVLILVDDAEAYLARAVRLQSGVKPAA